LLLYLRKLGWYYGLGICLAAVALFAFGKLAGEVLEGEVQPVNRAVLESLHARANPSLDRLALGLTYLGGVVGTTVVASLVGLLFLWRRRFFDMITFAVVVLGGGLLVLVLKQSFRQPRPNLFESLSPEHGYGFPSGHALLSICLYGYSSAMVVLDGPRLVWRWCGAAALIVLAFGIAWSRLYLGVHWLSDVIGGDLVAMFWVACCLMAGRFTQSRWAAGRNRAGPALGQRTDSP
jgi:undecaprenyl-diphosphatase